MDRLLWRPAEAFSALGISRTKGYQLLKDGSLPVIRVGHSQRIPDAALRDWIAARLLGDNGAVIPKN